MKRVLVCAVCIVLVVICTSCSKFSNVEIKKPELPQRVKYIDNIFEEKVICEITDVSYQTGFFNVEVIATVKMDKHEKSSSYSRGFPLLKCFLKNSENIIVSSQIKKIENINEGDSINVKFSFNDLVDNESYTPTFKLISELEN